MSGCGSVAAGVEESPEQRGRVVCAHPRDDFGPHREPPIAHDVVHRADGAGLVVPRAEYDPGEVRLQECSGAHQARLETDDQSAPGEVP